MKFGFCFLTFGLMSLAACRTTNPSAAIKNEEVTPGKITTVSVAAWKTISEGKTVVELGCVCEESNDRWNLYRYASAAMDVYKISLSEKSELDACIKSKFNGDNCQLKF